MLIADWMFVVSSLSFCYAYAEEDAASRAEALACAREAVGIYRLRYRAMPAAFERNLGIAGRTLMGIAEANGLNGAAELQAISEWLAATGDGTDG